MTPPLSTHMTENWNLLGHEWAVDMLRQHVANESQRHAYLITGSPGLGRRSLALAFARSLTCSAPPAPGEYCDECRNCRQMSAMQHPDLTIIQAEKEGGMLKVEQIRELRKSVLLSPYQAPYRIVLLLRFQEANPSAANALLKTLEEAPSKVILLLTADNAEQLLPTIVSRCEIIRLRPLPTPRVEEFLREKGADAEKAQLLAHLSAGRPGYALRLLEDETSLEFRSEKLDEFESLLSASRVGRFAYAEKLAKDKEAFRETLLLWLSLWRDVMLQRAGEADAITNIDRRALIENLAEKLSLADAKKLLTTAENGISQLIRNVNARLLAEVILLGFPKK
ncbi:MAG: DNA polymerase III subunit delta' [Anaerolineae bacterium]|jgi:DNA polymerase III subunit delta'|nr:DNA polymerase III subunit delta' [Anaerolineae bacterium]MBT7324276.1 DNA polymerase III subunit delta' [Anaerolineae bacterium]